MGERTQLQLDFIGWLAELSAGVKIENHCWLETEDGDANGGDFCPKCVEIQAQVNRREKGVKKADRFVHVHSDGGSSMETDSQPFCERCGAMLLCSLTRYAVGEELAWLDNTKPMTADELGEFNAASFHGLLTGMGDWDQEADWPRVEPHARRMLAAAGREVVAPGTVRFRPADAMEGRGWFAGGREAGWWSKSDSIWLSIYEWFAIRLAQAFPDRSKREFLNNTSSINNYEFCELTHEHAAFENVAELLGYVGWPSERGEFLRSLGLCSSGDLDRPILIPDQRCEWPTWDVRGRRLRKPGPNECHPRARTVTHAGLRFSFYDEQPRWTYSLYYDYTHYDRSSWCISIEQADGQALPEFMAAVSLWMDDVLVPAKADDRFRSDRLRDWDKSRESLRGVFYFSDLGEDYDVALANELAGVEWSSMRDGKITIKDGDGRLAVLRRWIEEDRDAADRAREQWEARQKARA